MDLQVSNSDIEKIRDIRFDALGTKHLFQHELAEIDWKNKAVDVLAVVVPILYFVIRFLAKGTEWASWAEHVWEILAVILLATAAAKLGLGWQKDAETYSRLRNENIVLTSRATDLLRFPDQLSVESVRLFFALQDRLENDAREALKHIPPGDKRRLDAYREGLKEYEPGSTKTVCPMCNASPWKYTPGSCQVCGNTPVENVMAALPTSKEELQKVTPKEIQKQ